MIILTLFLHITCLLTTFASNANALQYAPCDEPDLDDLPPSSSLNNHPRYPFTTPIGSLDDLTKFIDHSPPPPPPPNAAHSDSPSDSNSDSNFNKKTLFIFLDTTSLLPTTHPTPHKSDSEAPKKFDPYLQPTIVRHLKHTFNSFAGTRQDEPTLRFGIISFSPHSQNDVEGINPARSVLDEMLQKMGIDPSKHGPGSGGLATVLCIRCSGIPEKVETWGFGLEYSKSEFESESELEEAGAGAGARAGADSKETPQWRMFERRQKRLERWMGEMARPVIGELREGNYGRVREMESTIPTVYVFAHSQEQRTNLQRTLWSLATKYHPSLQIVVVDQALFPDLVAELGLDLSASDGGDDGVAGAVVWPQKSSNHDSRNDKKIEKLMYHYPCDKPITEASIKQWGLDLYLGRVRAWVPPSTENEEGKKGDTNGKEEVLRGLKDRVGVVKGGKKATRKVTKRTGGRGGLIPGVKIRVAGRDEL